MKFKKGQQVVVTKNKEESQSAFWVTIGPTVEVKKGKKGIVQKVDDSDNTVYVKFPDGETWVRKDRLKVVDQSQEKKISLDDVILPAEQKELIHSVIVQHKQRDKIFKDWGFSDVFEKGTAMSMLFYGPPGTGKTMAGQAIAESLGKELMIVRGGDIWSKYVGDDEKNVRKVFDDATSQEAVLLFDECDSLISRRDGGHRFEVSTVNELLGCLEWFEGIVIFTTNRLPALDPAVERRLSAKIGFEPPTEELRRSIWQRMLPKKAPIAADVLIEQLAKFPLPGGHIKNVVLGAARTAAYLGKKKIDMECFTLALQHEVRAMNSFKRANEMPTYTPGIEIEKPKVTLS